MAYCIYIEYILQQIIRHVELVRFMEKRNDIDMVSLFASQFDFESRSGTNHWI